jgi:threonine dehydrogenase-like Zn-dependent dehydrogenase
MMALVWKGKNTVKVESVPRPLITEPQDCIVRITLATICGSDLHLLHNSLPGSPMKMGDILGHEGVGVVEEVGANCKKFKRGDRVVISAIIGEGECQYCKEGSYSLCDRTNNSEDMYRMFGGHRSAGVFGYSALLGGYPGLQAQYARVPHADVNLMKLPDDVPDEKAVFLSDVLCTAWHACEIGEVTKGKTVVVWGCGPIGLMAQKWAWVRGAKRVIGIDSLPDRLNLAKNKVGSEVINYKEHDPVETLAKLIPGGPDVCIECVGFRYAKGLVHAIESTLGLETDVGECLDECIKVVKKNGIVSIIGDYVGYTNHFPIGIAMTKALTLRGSQVFVQKYWHDILKMLQKGDIDPSFLITHDMSLEKADEAYDIFDRKSQESMKILLRPPQVMTTTITSTTKITTEKTTEPVL